VTAGRRIQGQSTDPADERPDGESLPYLSEVDGTVAAGRDLVPVVPEGDRPPGVVGSREQRVQAIRIDGVVERTFEVARWDVLRTRDRSYYRQARFETRGSVERTDFARSAGAPRTQKQGTAVVPSRSNCTTSISAAGSSETIRRNALSIDETELYCRL